MNERQRLEGFKALLKSEMAESFCLEDRDGSHRLWSELTVASKLNWIARDAAYYDLAPKHFIDTAREILGQADAGEAAMELLLEKTKELRRLEKLLPDDGRTESTPLVDRFKEILDAPREPCTAEQERVPDGGRNGR